MNVEFKKLMPYALTVLLTFGLAACAGRGGEAGEGEGERAESAEGSEGGEHANREAGEHAEGVENPQENVMIGEEGGEHEARAENRERGEHEGEGREGGEGEGEHGGEGGEGEHGGEGHDEGGEGEEPGVYIAQGETWDMVRRGARLVLSYDATLDAFLGRVENTTEGQLCAVRVEVHLADGPELGPTPRMDVAAGASVDIMLPAEGEAFEAWTAHPELSSCGG